MNECFNILNLNFKRKSMLSWAMSNCCNIVVLVLRYYPTFPRMVFRKNSTERMFIVQ